MLVKAKTGFWLSLLYYPNMNLKKIPVFFLHKQYEYFFFNYILTNWNLQASVMEAGTFPLFLSVLFYNV